MKNFFKKVSSFLGSEKLPFAMLIMIPAIILGFFIYNVNAASQGF